ncbi:RelA/SpoT domain-containing protein [Sulfitobacter sp. AS59]|uniref:RelA/SpoT domain-containing protein n=1 Tax=Sulfitobacter sp. AS59 TaxID=3135784 RepID=UPI00316F6841
MSKDISPEHSKSAVNRAGKRLSEAAESSEDLSIIENWRAAHNHVLNTFQANLRRRAKLISARTPVQRIKRLDTIQNKLVRFETMQLSRMHDIVGCRIVFDSLDQLQNFRREFNRSRFSHKRRVKTNGNEVLDAYNYIDHPKTSGYRGVHDVFEYRAKQGGSLKGAGGEKWNGLNIEIQYRTTVQHAWATAVEICDKFTDNHGKFSNAPEEYLRYFVLASELLRRRYEPHTCRQLEDTNQELVSEFMKLEEKHGMLKTLKGVKPSDEEFTSSRNSILIFNEIRDEVTVKSYPDFRTAVAEYFRLEREKDDNTDVVLVAADDAESVRFGFKNYFSDAREFVELTETACSDLFNQKFNS